MLTRHTAGGLAVNSKMERMMEVVPSVHVVKTHRYSGEQVAVSLR